MITRSYAGGNIEHIQVPSQAARDVQAYIDYYNIVGDDDGGKMMSDAEFEAYKKKVAYARANHLYVYYVNAKGNECKAIGPSSMCFCKHRFRNHNFDNIKTKKVNCKQCKCQMFNHIPVHGSLDIKCDCHHSYEDHDPNTKKCLKGCKCTKFSSNYTCDCRMPYNSHTTVIETKEERIKKGKKVDSGNNMVAGAGGLTSFGDMVQGSYQDMYQELLDGSAGMKMIGDDGRKMLPGSNGGKGSKGGNAQGVGVSALELFNKPNKFAGDTTGVKGLSKQMAGLGIKKK
jgi:hypothetical protein